MLVGSTPRCSRRSTSSWTCPASYSSLLWTTTSLYVRSGRATHTSRAMTSFRKSFRSHFQSLPFIADQPAYVRDLIPEWSTIEASLGGEISSFVSEIAVLALGSNPRQVKRFVNSLLVVNRVIEEKGLDRNLEMLAAMIGLQLGWPEAFTDFQEAVLAGDEPPTAVLERDEEDKDRSLDLFALGFLVDADKDALRGLLQMTGIVATVDLKEGVDEEKDVSRSTLQREEELERFLQALWERGFQRSPRSERLLYHPDMPNVRFVIAKHVVRFEKREGDNWRLWESYLMTRELPLALQVIAEPDQHFTNRG